MPIKTIKSSECTQLTTNAVDNFFLSLFSFHFEKVKRKTVRSKRRRNEIKRTTFLYFIFTFHLLCSHSIQVEKCAFANDTNFVLFNALPSFCCVRQSNFYSRFGSIDEKFPCFRFDNMSESSLFIHVECTLSWLRDEHVMYSERYRTRSASLSLVFSSSSSLHSFLEISLL